MEVFEQTKEEVIEIISLYDFILKYYGENGGDRWGLAKTAACYMTYKYLVKTKAFHGCHQEIWYLCQLIDEYDANGKVMLTYVKNDKPIKIVFELHYRKINHNFNPESGHFWELLHSTCCDDGSSKKVEELFVKHGKPDKCGYQTKVQCFISSHANFPSKYHNRFSLDSFEL